MSELTPSSALKLIRPFFKDSWSLVTDSDVVVERIKGGLCSSIFKVSRLASGHGADPLVIRIRGGNMIDVNQFDSLNNYNATMVFSYEMSNRRLGPKLYGMFHDKDIGVGSIEEFIDGPTLTPNLASDADISRSIAEQLAKVHAIKNLPLKTSSMEENLNQIQKFAETFEELREHFFSYKAFTSASSEDKARMERFNVSKELEWLKCAMDRFKCRQTLILMDMNFLNCMTRTTAHEHESRIVFIDFDTVQYNLRGIDIGQHFFARVIDFESVDMVRKNVTFPSKDEKLTFLKHYQSELKRLGAHEDFDEGGIDSIDNLWNEVLIGSLQWFLFHLSMMFANYETYWTDAVNFFPLSMLCMKSYLEFKSEINQKLNA